MQEVIWIRLLLITKNYCIKKTSKLYLEGILNADKNREIDYLINSLEGEFIFDGSSTPDTLLNSQMWYKRVDKDAS